MSSPTSSVLRSPINPNVTKVTQVDQGVDFTSPSPYLAVAGGTVVHIDPNFYNGTPAVYVKLDHPYRSPSGRTYDALYYSETRSLVTVGQHVNAGDQVIAAGNAEIGFARRFGVGWLPAAHGTYDGHTPTVAGKDFYAMLLQSVYTGAGDKTPGTTVTIANPQTGETTTTSGPGAGLFSFLNDLLNPAFWLRVVEVMGGGFLILLGLYLLAKQVGLAQSPPAPIRRAGLSDSALAEMQFSPGRAASGAPPRRVVRHEVTEQAERRQAVRERAEGAGPSDEIPF